MEHDSAPTIVNLKGSLTVDRASDLKGELVAVLDASDNVLLCLSLVEDLDLACLQVFYAAAKSAAAGGKQLHFVGTVPARVIKRLVACGLCRGGSGKAEDFESGLVDFIA
jgi:anti-anti-sigma regulatory factor